jgi:hypothetical protein
MKDPGVSFTPRALAEDVAQRVFERPTRGVLDPACGDGALLEAAWRVGRAHGLSGARLFGFEIDPDLAERARERLRALIPGKDGELAARNVITTDALHTDLDWPSATSIVANPPWVSFSGRRSRRWHRGRAHGFEVGSGWPSLHGAFLERISRHVAEEGTTAAVLLPASVCDGEGYGALREVVTSRVELAAPPRELGEDAFPGVVEPAVLIELSSGGCAARGSRSPWTAGVEDPLLERLRDFPRLPPECFRDPGVHSGNAARELIVRSGRLDLPGVREGRDLAPYRLDPPRIRLNVELERTPERRFRFGTLERYRAVPVLLRQTADRPIAALHTEPTYFRNTLLACTPPAELEPAFVVAVLNSSVVGAWHRASFRDARQRTFPQVKVAHLRSLPLPIVRRNEAPALHDRVVQLVRAGDHEGAENLVAEAFGVGPLRAPEDAGARRLA